MLLFFIRWVVSIRWAFFKNPFGYGSSTLCYVEMNRGSITAARQYFEKAIALLNKRQYKQAAQLLNRIVAAPADPGLAKATQDLLAQIRQLQKQN